MDFDCWPLGDSALLLRFGALVDAGVNAGVHRAAASLARADLPGVRSIAPSYAALVLTLDLPAVARAGGAAALVERVRASLTTPTEAVHGPARVVEVPVHYGGDDGPDLEFVAEATGLGTTEVIRLHSGADYQVAMLGFRPGFPYLLGLPAKLRLPRRSSVRARVAAGSVAIAGAQAGIYPSESPGGWHVLGHTGLRLFDPARSPPSLLLPGDRVRFVPVS